MQGNESWPAAVRAVCSLQGLGLVFCFFWCVFFFFLVALLAAESRLMERSPLWGKGAGQEKCPVTCLACLLCMGTWDGSEKME